MKLYTDTEQNCVTLSADTKSRVLYEIISEISQQIDDEIQYDLSSHWTLLNNKGFIGNRYAAIVGNNEIDRFPECMFDNETPEKAISIMMIKNFPSKHFQHIMKIIASFM